MPSPASQQQRGLSNRILPWCHCSITEREVAIAFRKSSVNMGIQGSSIWKSRKPWTCHAYILYDPADLLADIKLLCSIPPLGVYITRFSRFSITFWKANLGSTVGRNWDRSMPCYHSFLPVWRALRTEFAFFLSTLPTTAVTTLSLAALTQHLERPGVLQASIVFITAVPNVWATLFFTRISSPEAFQRSLEFQVSLSSEFPQQFDVICLRTAGFM